MILYAEHLISLLKTLHQISLYIKYNLKSLKCPLNTPDLMKFQLSYFKSWKMMLWKCYTQYATKFGKLSSAHKDWKKSVFIPFPKKGNAKECSNYRTIALISHASKVMLKILQARLQQYMNRELPDVQAGFR